MRVVGWSCLVDLLMAEPCFFVFGVISYYTKLIQEDKSNLNLFYL